MDSYNYAGHTDIKTLTYIAGDGSVIDIKNLVVGLDIFSSISYPYLKMNVTLSDSIGLIHNTGFTGREVLIISYRINDPELTSFGYTQLAFHLYNISDRSRNAQKNENYTFYGISMEYMFNFTEIVNRTYTGKASEMIEKIINQYMIPDEMSRRYQIIAEGTKVLVKKSIDIDETKGDLKLIIPPMGVNKCINFINEYANNDDNIPLFMYYEDHEGFKYKDMIKLINEDPYKFKYTYLPSDHQSMRDDDPNVIGHSFKINNYKMEKDTNSISDIRKGLYKANTIALDVVRKNFKETVFEYKQNTFNRINDNRFIQAPSEISGECHRSLIMDKSSHDSDSLFTGGFLGFFTENPKVHKKVEYHNRSKSFKTQIQNKILNVVVPGNDELNVGMLVNFSFPQASTTMESETVEDKYMSGKYLITKIRNNLNLNKQIMYTSLECIKDTEIL